MTAKTTNSNLAQAIIEGITPDLSGDPYLNFRLLSDAANRAQGAATLSRYMGNKQQARLFEEARDRWQGQALEYYTRWAGPLPPDISPDGNPF